MSICVNRATIQADHWHFHRRLPERNQIDRAPYQFSRIPASIWSGNAELLQRRIGDGRFNLCI
jgi:hypothetical protein